MNEMKNSDAKLEDIRARNEYRMEELHIVLDPMGQMAKRIEHISEALGVEIDFQMQIQELLDEVESQQAREKLLRGTHAGEGLVVPTPRITNDRNVSRGER